MRLFIAIPLPEEISERVAGVCRGLPDVRWVSPERMHLTLRFLGDDISPERMEAVVDVLATVRCPGFVLRPRGIGRFMHPRSPGVLWLGVHEEPALRELHRRIDSRLSSVGFASEKRAFEPHITIARLKGVSDSRVLEYLQLHGEFATDSFEVEDFVLFSSVLRPGGAQHEIEEVFPLELPAANSDSGAAAGQGGEGAAHEG
ncbi:MAG: RNA 2',3'-cyclic phosphodiesterase [bacterium]|nr:RNA 2',3'-cyclic phosphodiesterase [bacterium]